MAPTQSTRPLIGLTGHKGAGKDTVAGILKRLYGYERQAWADALKREVYNAFGRALLLYETHERWYNGGYEYSDWLAFVDTHKHAAPDTEYGWIRPLLQFWGTEYRRNLCGDDYWTRQLKLVSGVVVTDCRFPNEVEAIRKAGGIMWYVYRPGHDGDNHASEAQIDNIPTALTIWNDGPLSKLEGEVSTAFDTSTTLLDSLEVLNRG